MATKTTPFPRKKRLHTEKSMIITCILPNGRGMPLIKNLREKKGIDAAHLNHSRVMGIVGAESSTRELEREVVTVIVSEKGSDTLFEHIFKVAEVNRPGGGMIYMGRLPKSTPFMIPDDLPEEA